MLIVCLRSVIGPNPLTTVIFELLALTETTAKAITSSLLHQHFPEEFLKCNWISFTLGGVSGVYHASPENERELHQDAEELSVNFLTIGRVLGVRWVASSECTLRAVWQLFTALHEHFYMNMYKVFAARLQQPSSGTLE